MDGRGAVLPAGRAKVGVPLCSGRDPLVVMMESANLGDFRDPPAIDGVSLPPFRRVHLEGLMRPPSMVVGKVVGEDPLEVPLAEHDGVIQALAPDGADQPLDVWVGPSLRMHPMRLLSVDVSE